MRNAIVELPDQRKAVIREAESWIGTPFENGQQLKGAGVDCGTFVCCVHANVGTCEPPHFPHYRQDWIAHSQVEIYLDEILKRTHEIDVPQMGDIALFHMGRVWGHGAIVVDWPTCVIHAHFKTGVEYADATKGIFAGRKVRFFSPWA